MVEILSPGNINRDLREKYDLYEEAGVREYWVVVPVTQVVLRYELRDGVYLGLRPETCESPRISSAVFEDFAVSGKDLFAS